MTWVAVVDEVMTDGDGVKTKRTGTLRFVSEYAKAENRQLATGFGVGASYKRGCVKFMSGEAGGGRVVGRPG